MKKQILTLTMVLALTATSALASGTSTVAKKAPAKTTATCVKPIANCDCAKKAAPEEATKPTEQQLKQKFEEKMAKNREEFYCKLGLTPEQKTKAEAADKKNRESAGPLFAKLHKEKAKLHEMKDKKCNCVQLCEQKMKVKAAKHAVKAHMEAAKKDFEAILTKDQLAKLKTMKPHEPKCGCPCHKKGYKHGHKHGEFGPEGHKGPAPEHMGPPPACEEGPHGPAPIGPPPANK